MDKVTQAATRVGILAFVAFIVWFTHDNRFLMLLILLMIARTPAPTRKLIAERFEDIEDRITSLQQNITASTAELLKRLPAESSDTKPKA